MKAFLDFLINTPKFDDAGNIISTIFGLSASILTLIGLTSIFISINSQHLIQKSRELLWDLTVVPYRQLDQDARFLSGEVFQKFLLYEQTINNKGSFTRNIIKFIKWTIITCMAVFALCLFLLRNSFQQTGEFFFILASGLIIIVLMGLFIFILTKINKIGEIGELPEVGTLFDASNVKSDFNTLGLAASTCRVYVYIQGRNRLMIGVGFPLPFRNLTVEPGVFEISEGSKCNYIGEHGLVKKLRIDPGDYYVTKGNYYWYRLSEKEFEVSENMDARGFDMMLTLKSEQGEVTVRFNDITNKPDMRDYYERIYYPSEIVEAYFKSNSSLEPVNRYLERNPDYREMIGEGQSDVFTLGLGIFIGAYDKKR